MKRKHYFTKEEKEKLLALLSSGDKDNVKLAKSIIKTSKTYKHYRLYFKSFDMRNRYTNTYIYMCFVNLYSH